MLYIKESFTAPSSDGIHTLAGVVFRPMGEIKGYFHIVHGMTEYIARYERIFAALAEEGYLSFGYDNLGHGHTARDDSELGYIAKKDGWLLLGQDVKVFSDAVFATYGKTDAQPYYLMGHSMGSFIVRLAAERYVKPDKLIVMGTGGSNPAAGAGLALIALIKLFCGERHISKLLDAVAFGSYNKKFVDEIAEAPNPWLTTDVAVRRAYMDDKYCTFKFTVSAMGDLIRLMKYVNSKAWYQKLPKDLPILLLSGVDDPVGNYSKGIGEVHGKLEKSGHKVSCILYPGARHEILNDFTYEQVKSDILAFVGE